MDPSLNPNAGQPPPFILGAADAELESGFDFWGVLNRRKWLVFLGLVTGLGLATVYYSNSSVIYESQAFVKIEPKQRFTPVNPGVGGIFPEQDEGLRHDRFMRQENIINEVFEARAGLEGLASFDDYPSRESKIGYIASNLEITQDSVEPTLYQVSYRNAVAKDAPAILNALVETYKQDLIDQYSEEKTEIVENLRKFDEIYKKEYKTEIDKLNQLILRKIDSNVMVNQNVSQSQKLLDSVISKLAKMSEERNAAALDRDRILAAQQTGPAAIRNIVWQLRTENKMPKDFQVDSQDRRVEQMESRIGLLEEEYREARIDRGEGHPTVKAARDRLERQRIALEGVLAGANEEDLSLSVERPLTDTEALGGYLQLLQNKIDWISEEITSLLKQQQLHTVATRDQARLNEEIHSQEKKTKYLEELLAEIRKRFTEITPVEDEAANDEGYRVRMTQVASEGKKVWPYLPVILGVGGLLGSLAGFGLGCLVELADKTFHNPDEIMRHLNVPLIGHIPVITQGKRYLVEGSTIEPTICTYHRPKSQTSEAFRAVRTALYFNTQGKQHSVIQVTSPTPGDGKSTLASNLAVSIAQSGKKVLLVDADMRRPRQHSVFGIEATEGFATVLSGRSAWRDCMYECDEIEGLILMPCGRKPQNPAELCSSPQVKELIEELRGEFDFVIIDTPPLLAVTDAGPIAARVDGVILTLRIKKNVRVGAERSTEMLRNIGANCIGLVVNGVGAQSGYGSQYTYGAYRAGYSYNGYGYGYGYGQGSGVGKYYEEDQRGRKVNTPAIEAETQEI